MPTGFLAASVTFVNLVDGWVLGSAPCSHQPCTSIVRTTDGGRHWRGIPAPVTSLLVGAGRPAADRLRFADRLHGYAFGQDLWLTRDGGAHWLRQATVAGIPHAVVTELEPTAGGVYALVSGRDTTYGDTDTHFRLARATGAGNAFHVIHDFGARYEVGDLVASGSTVYAMAAPVGRPGKARLYRTQGSIVSPRTVPSGCAMVSASTATALLALCGSGVASGSMGNRFLRGSTDGGRTWTALRNPGRGAGYDDTGVADAGGGHAVIGTYGGNYGSLLTTADAGAHWHPTLVLRDGVFSELGFEDAETGVVVVNRFAAASQQTGQRYGSNPGVLYRTSDHGSHWHRLLFNS